jgi:lipopolysaccharide biosynthesis glycosyltransferase
MTCYKPDAMMLAETDYITWVDCDGMFTGNVSEMLTPNSPDQIHIRVRDMNENNTVFVKCRTPEDKFGVIPQHILEIWRNDIGENSEPALQTCCSACFLSLHRSYRDLLKKWREQMIKVLPEGDAGVFDDRSEAYFQTDESVLNSLLCFGKNVPVPTPEFKLDKNPDALYVHFAFMPKPWQMWNQYNFRHFDFTVSLVEWAVAANYELPGPIPHTLKRRYKSICALEAKAARYIVKLKKILKIK